MFTKILKRVVIIFMISLIFVPVGSAREFADIYLECGLGALIAPRTPAVAAITNVTWDLGTTAVLSHVSSPETCEGGKAKTAAFIHESYESLEADLARGQGAYLDSLVMLTGVGETEKASFVHTLRNTLAAHVAKPEYAQQDRFEKAENLYNMIYQQG